MSLRRRVWRRLSAAYNAAFRRRNHVYRWEPGPPLAEDVELLVERFELADAVPFAAREAIESWGGERAWRQDEEELRQGAVLWTGRWRGAIGSAWMSRPGALFRAWFVPLGPADLVLFRGRTSPALRGLGLSPAMMRAIVARELRPGGKAYVDVSVHNAPSIRAIEKAGFRRVATMKPVSRKEAYG